MIEKVRDKADSAIERWASQARVKYLPRWIELSGGESVDDIDYSNPYIHLEFLLCDPRNLSLISRGKHRDKFLAKLTPEEKDIYLNFTGDDGKKYTELEHPRVMRSIVSSLKHRGRAQ